MPASVKAVKALNVRLRRNAAAAREVRRVEKFNRMVLEFADVPTLRRVRRLVTEELARRRAEAGK